MAEVDANQRSGAVATGRAGASASAADELSRAARRAPESYLRQSWRRFRMNKTAMAALRTHHLDPRVQLRSTADLSLHYA